jgi:hypothetical protein
MTYVALVGSAILCRRAECSSWGLEQMEWSSSESRLWSKLMDIEVLLPSSPLKGCCFNHMDEARSMKDARKTNLPSTTGFSCCCCFGGVARVRS